MDTAQGMKVLHLINSGGMYGAEMILLDLMDEQRRCGLVPVLGSIRDRTSGAYEIETEASRRGHVVMTWQLNWGLDVKGARKISSDAMIERIELLHTHGYKANIHASAVIRRMTRIPWVTTLHGWTATRKLSAKYFYEILDGVMVRWADRVVSVSPNIIRKWRMVGVSKKRHEVIPNGIRCRAGSSKIAGHDRKAFEFCSEGFVIGSIGRLSREKNYSMLVEALWELVQGQIDARVIIFGDGEERSRLLNLAERLGVGSRLFLAGYRTDARRFLPLFDVFALTSLTEGLPISLLEAMDAGIPVVAPDVGDVGNVLDKGNFGVVYRKGDLQEFISSLIALCKNPELCGRFATGGQARVKERYTTETMAASYRKTYEAVCGQGNGAVSGGEQFQDLGKRQ
jgi:glycosyltransferase involved in cell wall biosynthesis